MGSCGHDYWNSSIRSGQSVKSVKSVAESPPHPQHLSVLILCSVIEFMVKCSSEADRVRPPPQVEKE